MSAGNLLRRDRLDVHPSPRPIEPHLSVHQREDRVIAAEPDVFARQKFRAALPDDDVAGNDYFAAKFFHAQPFADAIAAVLDAALSFLWAISESCWLRVDVCWSCRRNYSAFSSSLAFLAFDVLAPRLISVILIRVSFRRWPTVR